MISQRFPLDRIESPEARKMLLDLIDTYTPEHRAELREIEAAQFGFVTIKLGNDFDSFSTTIDGFEKQLDGFIGSTGLLYYTEFSVVDGKIKFSTNKIAVTISKGTSMIKSNDDILNTDDEPLKKKRAITASFDLAAFDLYEDLYKITIEDKAILENMMVEIFREELQKEQAKMFNLPEKLRKCKACNTILILGQAIDPLIDGDELRIMMIDNTLSWDDVKFIDVWKCPDCGVSTSLTD